MTFHNIPQGTDEWMQLRIGKITASNFGTIMANGDKPFGEPAKRYAVRIAVESLTKTRLPEYQNGFMERGIELEAKARELYQDENIVEILPGGFMTDEVYGGSADGRIEPDGLVEIKSVIYTTHFERFKNKDYDTAYRWQIQGNILLYGAKWCDFISYCPEFPSQKQLYVFRVERNEQEIKKLTERLEQFETLVKEYKQILS
jgi:hypothetical protein